MDVDDTKPRIFELMAKPSFMPMRKRGLAKALEISDEDYGEFRDLLEEMAEAGEIAELRRGKYGLPDGSRTAVSARSGEKASKHSPPHEKEESEESKDQPEVSQSKPLGKHARVGRIEVKRGGMGFLLSDPPGNDVFIAPEDLGGALSGDLVAVEMKRRVQRASGRGRFGGGHWSRPAGRVIRIMERARPRIVGTYRSYKDNYGPVGYLVPDAPGMFTELDIYEEDRADAKSGDKVAVELIESKTAHRPGARPFGRVVQVFGPAGEADADILAIVENFGVRTRFPEEVIAEAEAISEDIPEEELARRTDYTKPVTFTIDPSDAKDHDDAVAIRKEDDGRLTLLVHIADVSHYVPEDGLVDIEARERGTSVYLPGSVYPMLPQKLSNNLCSLKEGKLRLTKTVSMTFSPQLVMQEVKIERSYIRSAAFLTYDQVKEALDDNRPELVRTPEIFEALQEMRVFADRLRKKRLATGSLDLELPESRLLLDEKLEVIGWEKVIHHWAHELIEDMMLAANRAVAQYLVEHEIPGLYRIHEDPDPDALERFVEFVREFGISIRPPIDRLKLKSVLDRVRGREYAHAIHMAMLTSLKQARYSAECQPHFALNFTRYLHFTSPIRRYPDLIVHRALDSKFKGNEAALPAHGKKRGGGETGREHFARMDFLRPLAVHSSQRERDAAAAEEEVKKFRQIQFLRRNLKESHPGIITSVRNFGFFVEMQDCFVEGLVRVDDLQDDYYEYYENQHMLQGRRKHRSFRLGDKVDVRILHIDLGKKEVTLEVV
jgi:ribonuclease R